MLLQERSREHTVDWTDTARAGCLCRGPQQVSCTATPTSPAASQEHQIVMNAHTLEKRPTMTRHRWPILATESLSFQHTGSTSCTTVDCVHCALLCCTAHQLRLALALLRACDRPEPTTNVCEGSDMRCRVKVVAVMMNGMYTGT